MLSSDEAADERLVLLESSVVAGATSSPAAAAAASSSLLPTSSSPDSGPVSISLRKQMSTQKVALLATMYMTYVVVIFSSSSVEVSAPAALDDPALGLEQEDLALALSVGQVATVVGKLFCGFAVDMRGANAAFYEAAFLIGVILCVGVACISLGLNSLALLSFVALKLAKSAVWPAMAKATQAAFDSSIFARVWGVLVTSSRFGAVFGGLLLSPIVLLGWAWPGLVVGGSCVLVALLLRLQTQRDRQLRGALQEQPAAVDTTISIREAARLYGRDPKLLLIAASEGMLLAVMDTSSLLPLFLHTQLGADLDEAPRIASLFPLGMVIATFAGGFVYDALGPAMRANLLCGLGFCSAGCYALLATTTAAASAAAATVVVTGTAVSSEQPEQVHAGLSPWWAGLLLFGAGACFAPAKYLPPTIYTLENVDSQHSGKVPGYFVSSIFFRMYPAVVDAYGWGAVWWVVAAMVTVSTACITTQQRLEAIGSSSANNKPCIA